MPTTGRHSITYPTARRQRHPILNQSVSFTHTPVNSHGLEMEEKFSKYLQQEWGFLRDDPRFSFYESVMLDEYHKVLR
jgi:hypothetical protein